MRLTSLLALPLSLALMGATQAPPSAPPGTGERIRGHIEFLSGDLLEGRDTGSRGHEIAASYVASQFRALGLVPGGPGGSWYQQVPFRRASLAGVPSVSFRAGSAAASPLVQGSDVAVRPSVGKASLSVDAPLVFAGHGIDDPVLGVRDYQGIDARGKIVVVLGGVPKGTRSDIAAHLGRSKAMMAARRGAVGLIELPGNPSMRWPMLAAQAAATATTWADARGATGQGESANLLRLSVSKDVAERFFAGARRPLAALQADAVAGRPLGAFPLTGRLAVRADSKWEQFSSPQVVAMLPGADPKLASEHVALMGHLDHIGVRKSAKPGEDAINNGALDNASGVATMIEVARSFVESNRRPRRSLMFLAVTGEELGLLGADYYTSNPTVPMKDVAALVNLDMPLLLYPFRDVIAFGAEHSNLVRAVDEAGRGMGITASPDPMPEQGLFTRSDHYRFVAKGVPSVFLMTGYANGGEAKWKSFLGGGCYHSPCDDVMQGIDWDAAARFGELNYRIARQLADAPDRPRWYADSYFGKTFGAGQPLLRR